MSTLNKLSKIFNESKEIEFNDSSKFIIMSDCHRGINTLGDNFAQNKNIFIAALRYYYLENYTYIEIGDGDELWENKFLKEIIANNLDVFLLMSMFYEKNRLYMLYGNHDIIKKNTMLIDNILGEYYDEQIKKYISLFPNIDIVEGLVLKYKETNDKILLTHGHQGDFLNDTIWKTTKFLIRHIWHPLESIGIQNPTSTPNSKKKKQAIEKRLIEWTKINNHPLIAGHTHKAVFPNLGENLYFNDGCCINPNYITGIEITNGEISLIKWSIKIKKNRDLYVDKDVLAGPTKVLKYFESL